MIICDTCLFVFALSEKVAQSTGEEHQNELTLVCPRCDAHLLYEFIKSIPQGAFEE